MRCEGKFWIRLGCFSFVVCLTGVCFGATVWVNWTGRTLRSIMVTVLDETSLLELEFEELGVQSAIFDFLGMTSFDISKDKTSLLEFGEQGAQSAIFDFLVMTSFNISSFDLLCDSVTLWGKTTTADGVHCWEGTTGISGVLSTSAFSCSMGKAVQFRWTALEIDMVTGTFCSTGPLWSLCEPSVPRFFKFCASPHTHGGL